MDSLSYQPSVLHPNHSLTHELDAAEVFPSVTCTYAGFEPALPNIPTMGVLPLNYHYRVFVPLRGFDCITTIRDRERSRNRTCKEVFLRVMFLMEQPIVDFFRYVGSIRESSKPFSQTTLIFILRLPFRHPFVIRLSESPTLFCFTAKFGTITN